MLITICILLALLLAVGLWLIYRNLKQPYLQPTKALPVQDQLKLQHRARKHLTQQSPRLRALFSVTQAAWIVGLVLILISVYDLEAKLSLLIFPTGTAITSVILLLCGLVLLFVVPLTWPTQSYDYWVRAKADQLGFKPAPVATFKRYRRQAVWSVLAFDLFILVAWISRALATSTAPVLVVEYLIICAIIAIPVVALLTLLIQLPYLYQSRYLELKSGQSVKFGTLHYQANRALLKQQPDLKKRVVTVAVARLIAFIFAIIAFWTLYANIIAPSFAVDTSAVFPAAIYALITLVILETIGALWPTKLYDYLRLLKTDQLPFKVSGSDRFAKFHYHLYYFHLCAGIVWLTIWLAIVGAYYYFG
ncbi:hypothetical protein D1831_05410 [Lactiplantibacillus garii]|uniref:Integral membrane protein n=1 Tax=Lactiplantibacillus garii TaxID=2306423 RepID=A0A3R8KJ69_9LACO|nr:hypothetical protein [Lactiplantibacillus garii]RRK10868.1 hypothetical protein D1831_05410 [Lactiplantibacillus garii]